MLQVGRRDSAPGRRPERLPPGCGCETAPPAPRRRPGTGPAGRRRRSRRRPRRRRRSRRTRPGRRGPARRPRPPQRSAAPAAPRRRLPPGPPGRPRSRRRRPAGRRRPRSTHDGRGSRAGCLGGFEDALDHAQVGDRVLRRHRRRLPIQHRGRETLRLDGVGIGHLEGQDRVSGATGGSPPALTYTSVGRSGGMLKGIPIEMRPVVP